MNSLTPVKDVLADVERSIHPTPAVRIAVSRAWGRVLTDDLSALLSLPPHDNSAMDGYAVRAEDTTEATARNPVTLTVVGRSYAGAPPAVPCAPGDAFEIATGAMLPAGADAIVRVEEVTRDGDHLIVTAPVWAGRDVRREAEDVRAGDRLLTRGTVLGMAQLAAAAAAGHRAVSVHRAPRVGVVLTGDEIASGDRLDPGQVPDALGPALTGAVQAEGGDLVVAGPVRDDDTRLAATLRTAADGSDLIITVGGVSVGPRDRVPAVVGDLGGVTRYQVAIRPGRPFAIGRVGDTPVLSLPGNPVAALVAFELFVRPALAQLTGRTFRPDVTMATLTADVPAVPGRLHVVPGRLGGTAQAATVAPIVADGSGRIASITDGDVWVLVPPGEAPVAAGTVVETRRMAGR